ncbi:MAG TPA: helix-turn-helix transcriptional regulator [Solirubrobacteraceae bacterium]|nr:helix-turn-helix transcriptional regulator [Solirubrobacteraceae bacterium]
MNRQKWSDVRAGRSTPEVERQIAIENLKLRLAEVRAQRGRPQREVAAALDTTQANISRIEHEPDPRLSTLSKYVAGLGGELHVTATFPGSDEPVSLTELAQESRREST